MEYLFLFLLGAAFGSFLNVCIHRIPKGESIVFPSSRCPSCGSRIAPYDNLPLVSYFILRGRCRHCGSRISIQYPVVEGISGLFLILLFLRFGWSLKVPVYFLFLSALLVIAFVDARKGIIPDSISIPLLVLGLLLSPLTTGLKEALFGALLGGGLLLSIAILYYHFTGKEGMGGGDVKLLAMIGAFLGWRGVFYSLFIGSATGSIVGVILSILKGRSLRHQPVPFGPFLSLGAVVYLLGDLG